MNDYPGVQGDGVIDSETLSCKLPESKLQKGVSSSWRDLPLPPELPMRILYPFYLVAGFLITLVLYPFFALHQRGRRRLAERYGAWGLRGSYVWFHGASVGEIKGLLPVCENWKRRFPEDRLLLTSQSPTGIEAAVDFPGERRLVPFDNPIWLKRALANVQVKAFIFGETELWPALLTYLHARDVPIHMINAVLSDAVFRRYQMLRGLFAPLLSTISSFSAATESYALRLETLGAPSERVQVLGNAKYSNITPGVGLDEQEAIRADLGLGNSSILVLGSIRPGEEDIWLSALRQTELLARNWQLVVAPRHQERFDYFAQKLRDADLDFRRYTDAKSSKTQSVVLLDTMGKLGQVYAISQAAFVGASLIPKIGGHNPLEPAACGVPVAMGPHYANAADVVEALLQRQALTLVRNQADVVDFLSDLLEKPQEMQGKGLEGKKVWEQAAGAAEAIVENLATHYDKASVKSMNQES